MSHHPPKPSQGWLCTVPQGKKAIVVRVSIEFYGADDNVTKTHRRTIIAHSKWGHTMCFDGYGPEHNETIKSLRKAIERSEVKFLLVASYV